MVVVVVVVVVVLLLLLLLFAVPHGVAKEPARSGTDPPLPPPHPRQASWQAQLMRGPAHCAPIQLPDGGGLEVLRRTDHPRH